MSERVLVKNASSSKQVRHARKKERNKAWRDRDDLKKVLATAEGRRVLWRIMEQCRTFETVYTGDNTTFYNAGKQDVGHFIMMLINDTDPNVFLHMMHEQSKERYEDGRQASELRESDDTESGSSIGDDDTTDSEGW